eukprot:15347688-Ditylum_brightwellii.AAC.1
MKIILVDIQDVEDMASSTMISNAEVRYVDTLEMDGVAMDIQPEYQMVPHDANKAASILSEVSPLHNSQAIYQLLTKR